MISWFSVTDLFRFSILSTSAFEHHDHDLFIIFVLTLYSCVKLVLWVSWAVMENVNQPLASMCRNHRNSWHSLESLVHFKNKHGQKPPQFD